MGPTLNSPSKEVVGLGSENIGIMALHGRSFGSQIKLSIYESGRSGEVVG